MFFTNWNFMRLVRLGFGVIFIIQAIQTSDAMMGFISLFFLFQAITNTGCCGINGCVNPPIKNSRTETTEVIYEEIK